LPVTLIDPKKDAYISLKKDGPVIRPIAKSLIAFFQQQSLTWVCADGFCLRNAEMHGVKKLYPKHDGDQPCSLTLQRLAEPF
jgi:hypothetical protein